MRSWFSCGLIVFLAVLMVCQPLAPLLAADTFTFRILKPLPNETITGTTIPIAVAFESTPDAPVVRVEAYLDSRWLLGGTVRNPIPAGSFHLDDADFSDLKVRPGRHTLYIKLFTNQGTMQQREQQIVIKPLQTLAPETNAPTVRILQPLGGANIAGKVNVVVDAQDDSGIAWVEIFINGKRFAMMNEPPFQIPLDPALDGLESGTYTLTAKATDLFNNSTESLPVKIIVSSMFGHTQIEKDLPQTQEVGIAGILPITSLALPSGGAGLDRQPFSNLISPLSNWASATSLPSMALAGSRGELVQTAAMDAYAVLPVKLLPSNEMARTLPTLSIQGFTTPPALAAMPTSLSPAGFANGGGLTSPRGLLVVPVTETPNGQVKANVQPGSPAIFIPVDATLTPEKSVPLQTATADLPLPVAPVRPAQITHPAPKVPAVTQPTLPAVKAPAVTAPAVKAVQTPVVSHPAAPVAPAPAVTRPVPPVKVPVLLIAKAPAFGTGINDSKARVYSGVAQPSVTVDVTPASLPTLGASAQPRVAPATGKAQARTSVVLAKAVPASDAAQRDDTLVLVAETNANSGTPAVAPVVKSAAKTTQSSIELRAPYTIKPGDTLLKIARAYATTPDELVKLNPGLSPTRQLPVDSRIIVPRTEARIYLDDHALKNAPQPYITQGFSMVPFRTIVEAKHGVVIWVPKTREVNAWANNTFMGLTIGSRTARINNDLYQLPVAASLHESRTMVPLRYMATALNLQIEYNASTGTYYLISRATR